MKFVTKEPINKGWSSDKKYCVTDENGTQYLLRVSDMAQHETKQSEFNMMKQVASFGVPMCQPIEFGTCEDGVYSIQSWIDGEDAEQVMSSYSDTEQYVYGLEAGRILRKIHSIPAPATQEDWEIRFNRIVWCAQKAPLFASGIVNGYFDDNVPMGFWRLLALYISSNTLSSVYWAIPFGQDEVNTMLNQAKEVLSWYDNMRNPVPTWYFKGYYLQYIDGIPFKLKSAFDFSFMKEYGTVFKVYDDQDSGNICFGTEKDGQRYFVKFAGASTEQYNGDPADAISRLKATLPIYSDLKHKNLIELIEAKEIGGGFAMVFKWADGDCMGRMYPAAHRRFMQLPVNDRLAVFSDILSFLECVGSRNYVAIDFYDGSIMYDFVNGKTTICDIDLFRKQPCINDMERMWGSSRFQSPEEYLLGADIDEITNVYTLGATAFALFGEYNRTREKWQLSDKLFEIATRAVSDDRANRQQTIRQFTAEWEAAL